MTFSDDWPRAGREPSGGTYVFPVYAGPSKESRVDRELRDGVTIANLRSYLHESIKAYERLDAATDAATEYIALLERDRNSWNSVLAKLHDAQKARADRAEEKVEAQSHRITELEQQITELEDQAWHMRWNRGR